MPLPNFLIVGAAKAGTTSLHNYLNQHPDIALPRKKETFFLTGKTFNEVNKACGTYEEKVVSNITDYKNEFQITREKAIGEVCAGYLYFYDQTIPNICNYCDDCGLSEC